jgi:2-hydroxychromene-2-carboxylate isomerase
MRRLLFFYDFGSPYTYLASTQIDAIAARNGLELTWEPALLGGIMKSVGNQPPATLAARARYMGADLARWAAHYGVPFRFNPRFPVATLGAMRAAVAVGKRAPARFSAFNERLFRAIWVDGRDLSRADVVAELAREVGVERETAGANDDPEIKDALRVQTERALATGAFGMPWFVLEDAGSTEAYFGNDRLDLLEARIRRGSPWPSSPPVAPIAD